MAFLATRESLIKKIAKLQQQQVTAQQEIVLRGLSSEQALLAFDHRFARIARLVRLLFDFDELAHTEGVSLEGAGMDASRKSRSVVIYETVRPKVV